MVKIGLEIHAYLNTKEKLFCNCKTEHGIKFSKPNTNICPICTGQPGAKPLLPNKIAIDKVIQIASILKCKINNTLIWQRKHYSWPDLPKGHQSTISGPYATENAVKGKFQEIGITEVHLEEDPAAWNPETGRIDYNRSGIPLIEIVTEPEFKSIEEVTSWLRKLISTLNYVKAIDKKLGIKADVNVSTGAERVEIKNINSLKNIELALKYEIERQKKEPPKIQHTRMFDSKKNATILMRTKEQAEDYRFIPEPDLPILKITSERISLIEKNIPETPEEKLKKFIKKYNIEKKYAEILIKKLDLVEFVEKVIEKTNPKKAVQWITIELLGALNYSKKELDEVEIEPEHFIELIQLLEKGEITELKAQEILRKFIPKSFSPKEEAKKNAKISNEGEIEKILQEVIKTNSKAVEDYKSGKKESINFLIGQVMKLSNKRADFKTAKELLERKLD